MISTFLFGFKFFLACRTFQNISLKFNMDISAVMDMQYCCSFVQDTEKFVRSNLLLQGMFFYHLKKKRKTLIENGSSSLCCWFIILVLLRSKELDSCWTGLPTCDINSKMNNFVREFVLPKHFRADILGNDIYNLAWSLKTSIDLVLRLFLGHYWQIACLAGNKKPGLVRRFVSNWL